MWRYNEVCGDTVNQHKVIKTCIFIKDMETEKCLQLCYWTEGLPWAVSTCVLRGGVLSIIDWKWNFSSSVNGHLQFSFSSFLVTIYIRNQEGLMTQGSVLICIWTHAVFRNITDISNFLCCMYGHTYHTLVTLQWECGTRGPLSYLTTMGCLFLSAVLLYKVCLLS